MNHNDPSIQDHTRPIGPTQFEATPKRLPFRHAPSSGRGGTTNERKPRWGGTAGGFEPAVVFLGVFLNNLPSNPSISKSGPEDFCQFFMPASRGAVKSEFLVVLAAND